jgi:hypothetical protein
MTTPETWVPELTFGARLALVRQRMGWNVKEAARICGVPAQSWRGWEVHGRVPHNLVTISMQIATATGCDYLWLVHGPNRGMVVLTPNRRYGIGQRLIPRQPAAPGLDPRRPVNQTRPRSVSENQQSAILVRSAG